MHNSLSMCSAEFKIVIYVIYEFYKVLNIYYTKFSIYLLRNLEIRPSMVLIDSATKC